MTDISIIIVCYRGWHRLQKCLEALDTFTGRYFSFEVIVVDNNSGDGMLENIRKRFPRFTFIISNINGGYGYACNLGARNSAGKYLLILNPDTIASENEISALLRTAEGNRWITLLSCRQVNEKGKESRSWGPFPGWSSLTGLLRSLFRKNHLPLETNVPGLIQPDWVSGSVIIIRREDFRTFRGFDEDFWMYFEDVDLCRRITDAGGKVSLSENVTIEHNHGGSSRSDSGTAVLTKTEVKISEHLYISKHFKGVNRSLLQCFLVINNLISGFISALAGLVFFFVPALFSRLRIFIRLCGYYLNSFINLSWISPRSVNYPKKDR